jgi:hypothetical protein
MLRQLAALVDAMVFVFLNGRDQARAELGIRNVIGRTMELKEGFAAVARRE